MYIIYNITHNTVKIVIYKIVIIVIYNIVIIVIYYSYISLNTKSQ